MFQISFYVPQANLEAVKNAMFAAGAGQFDNYENCAWQTHGTGQFKPINNANPAVGALNTLTVMEEYKVEMMCAKENLDAVIKTMKFTHPYEEVAFSIIETL